jgi:hypothetical protein
LWNILIMSNVLSIQFTKFTNINKNFNPIGNNIGEEATYGFRVYDGYGKTYSDTFETFSDLLEFFQEKTLADIMEYVVLNDEEFAYEPSAFNGVEFNGSFFDWDEMEEKGGYLL